MKRRVGGVGVHLYERVADVGVVMMLLWRFPGMMRSIVNNSWGLYIRLAFHCSIWSFLSGFSSGISIVRLLCIDIVFYTWGILRVHSGCARQGRLQRDRREGWVVLGAGHGRGCFSFLLLFVFLFVFGLRVEGI
jgi:hypothetical protein